MNNLVFDFDKLKLSAFTKASRLSGSIHDVTIGPNSRRKTPPEPRRQEITVTTNELRKSTTPPSEDAVPIRQVLRELEIQRQKQVEEAVKNRCKKFEEFSKSQNHTQWLEQQKAFIAGMRQQERTILLTMQQYDTSKQQQNETLVKHYQDVIQRKMQIEKQLEQTKAKQKLFHANVETIKKCQINFRNIYQEIIAILKTCNATAELKQLLGDEFMLFKMLPEAMEEVLNQCKTLQITDEDVRRAIKILNQMENFKTKVEQDVASINRKEEVLQVPQKAVVEPQIKRASESEAVVEKPTPSKLEQYVSASNLRKYVEIKQFLQQHLLLFQELSNDDQLKQFRFDCKKAVNIPLNAISAVNAAHLKDKYTRLSGLLSGTNVTVADRQVNAARHPQGVAFCMDLLAKKFVLQGDLLISSNPEAAFCYASVIVSLWNDFPVFGKLLLGYFYLQCPYLVPFYIPKTEGQSNEDYYSSLGYQYVNDQIEKQDKFLKRTTGILRLYFAIFIAKPRRGQTKNPYGIQNAWTFLASLLKLEPQLDITATILHTFLETVGFEMERTYGAAFQKILRIIVQKFVPAVKRIDSSGGPITRLEVILQDHRQNGRFEPPHGILSSNFW